MDSASQAAKPELIEAALLALGREFSEAPPALKRVASGALFFARIDEPARMIVLDERALILAAIDVGRSERRRSSEDADGWFADWVLQKNPGLISAIRRVKLKQGDIDAAYYVRGCVVGASDVVRDAVVHAQTYPGRAAGHDPPDWRHIFAALSRARDSDLVPVAWSGLRDFGLRFTMSDATEWRAMYRRCALRLPPPPAWLK